MSKLGAPNGDDHPDAAQKNLRDSAALLAASRADGAAYLSGYVVECSLKTIYQLETGSPLTGHNWNTLHQQASAVAMTAGAKTARYIGNATANILSAPVAAWQPGMRYRSPAMTQSDAEAWHQAASQIFEETIAQMRLDGEL